MRCASSKGCRCGPPPPRPRLNRSNRAARPANSRAFQIVDCRLYIECSAICNLQSAICNEVVMPSMVDSVPLSWVLLVAGALFCIGLFGALSRRNTVGILLGVELMLNAVNINLVAFWRYLEPNLVAGQIFALFIITVAAAEAAVGLAMIIAIYRTRLTVNADEVDTLKG